MTRETRRGGFITAIVRQLRSTLSSLGRIGPHSRPRPERNSHGSPNSRLAWIMHAHRYARDYERLVQHSENLSPWAVITLMTRRLTQGKKSLALLPAVQAA